MKIGTKKSPRIITTLLSRQRLNKTREASIINVFGLSMIQKKLTTKKTISVFPTISLTGL